MSMQKDSPCNTEKTFIETKPEPYESSDVNRAPELQYLEEKVFPILLPLLEKTLFYAIHSDSLKRQKSLFNGIDFIAENLWNNNPCYPERKKENLIIHQLPWVQEWLKKCPRLYYPKSWLLNRSESAIKIQSYVRGYNVRKQVEVQELRNFWKILKEEKQGGNQLPKTDLTCNENRLK